MKISEEAAKAIKEEHELLTGTISLLLEKDAELFENEIIQISNICDELGIEVSDEEITFIRYIAAHSMLYGYKLASDQNKETKK